MNRQYYYDCYFLFFILCTSFYANASTINGFVRLKNGTGLQDVTVSVLTASFYTKTNNKGFYVVTTAAGSYTIEFSKQGYQSRQINVTLAQNETVTVIVTLALNNDTLPTVSVTTKQGLHQLEKNAKTVVEMVDEKRIEQSPDITIADVAQHVSGITVLNNNSGKDVQTVIRGMAPKYNVTLLNGIKIPSPDDNSRNIPLNIFPADMVQRIEVYKDTYCRYGSRCHWWCYKHGDAHRTGTTSVQHKNGFQV